MKKRIKENTPIILILALASFLYIWNIWGEGYANSYYAAGVYSMGQNLHPFFYNSLDSVGFVTIDKPPLGFWIQVLFTKVFGFSGAVLVLPEAISGVLSVYLAYRIVKKRFGEIPGLISALVLALTPIFAAVSRNNTIDGILILVLVLAADQAIKAAEKSSAKHLIFAGILIGLGFNIKMLQAYMVIPAVYLTYLIFAKQKFIKKILVCALSAIILIVISLSWVVAVDLVDEDSRPYIGSSDTNSAVELVFGHNGLSRILGRGGMLEKDAIVPGNVQSLPKDERPRLTGDAPNAAQTKDDFPNANNNLPILPPAERNGQVPYGAAATQGSGIAGETGDASILRLFNDKNAGQISWLMLPAIMAALISMGLVFMKEHRKDVKFITYFFFSMWLIPMYIYFSFAEGITHRYYFAMMGPAIAALIGIGFLYLIKMEKKIWIPIAFAATAASQIYIQSLYGGWMDWLVPVCSVIFILSLAAIIMLIIKKFRRKIIIGLMCVLLIMPGVWAFSPLIYSDNSQLPIAGPELINQKDSFDDMRDFSGLIDYLKKNRDGATYLAMTESSMQNGAELIVQSGEAVMVLGGFNGGDEILTLEEFVAMVDAGEVKFALVSQTKNQNANAEIYAWIAQNGEIVPPKVYGGIAANIKVFKLS